MKTEEEFVGQTQQFADLLRSIADRLTNDQMYIRGTKISLPDVDMEYKMRHKYEYGANKLSISIEWLDGPEIGSNEATEPEV